MICTDSPPVARWANWLPPFVFLVGLAYMALRYRAVGAGLGESVLYISMAVAIYLASTLVGYLLFCMVLGHRNASAGDRSTILVAVLGLALMTIVAMSYSKRIWAGLVAVQHVDQGKSGGYWVWRTNGTTATAQDVPLEQMFRHGDETCHLAAARAIGELGPNPWKLNALVLSAGGSRETYWLRRHFHGHPPGLAMAFSPMAWNPPACRVASLLIFACCAIAAYLAGTSYSGERSTGWLFLVLFAFIPDVLWWHSYSVSSDMLPCLPCFLAFGALASFHRHGHFGANPARSFKSLTSVGVLLSVGTFCTYTACLATLASSILLLRSKDTRNLKTFAVVAMPSVVAVAVSIWFSRVALGGEGHLLLDRAMNLAGKGPAFNPQGMTPLSFVMRLPQDIGPPLCVVVLGSLYLTLQAFYSRRSISRLIEVAGALAVIVPSVFFFWPQIRFMYPGWLFVIVGVGVPQLWGQLEERSKAFMLATVSGFALSKFIALALLV